MSTSLLTSDLKLDRRLFLDLEALLGNAQVETSNLLEISSQASDLNPSESAVNSQSIAPVTAAPQSSHVRSTQPTPSSRPLAIAPFEVTSFNRVTIPTLAGVLSRKLAIAPFGTVSFGKVINSTAFSGSANLSASFDLRTYGWVTPVKDQGNCGSCWAFATYGSLESATLKQKGISEDFSENHLKNYHGFDWSPCEGGDDLISLAYLSRGAGPVDEISDPYQPYDDRPSPGGVPRYAVNQALWFDTDPEMKSALMNYGALFTSMYWNPAFFNPQTNTYYYRGRVSSNHCVTIVGWDDNKIVPGAPTRGAWLAKNSWGTTFGEQGYFWLSYADGTGGNLGVSFSKVTAPYGRTYNHDKFGLVQSWNVPYGMNAFTARANESLKAVGFYTLLDGASYEINVYDTFQNGRLTNLLSTQTGTFPIQGYHVVQLPTPVRLKAGDQFYVMLKVINGGAYPMASDGRLLGYSSQATASPGESYGSFDGQTWQDLNPYDSSANLCIKALVGKPELRIADAQVIEGQVPRVLVNLSLAMGNSQPVTVELATVDGTALAGSDYISQQKQVTFLPGETLKRIAIPLIDDNFSEADETFTVVLRNPTNALIADGRAIITISDTLKQAISTQLPATIENLTLLGNDNINGTGNANGNALVGNLGHNLLKGRAGNDWISGRNGSDTLQGDLGDDILNGGQGRDTLIGVNPSSANPGWGEVDQLIGGIGQDRFVLGSATNVYYMGNGEADFAVIRDFTFSASGGDVIQIKGRPSDYTLAYADAATTIAYNNDLIAKVMGIDLTVLPSNQVFVSV